MKIKKFKDIINEDTTTSATPGSGTAVGGAGSASGSFTTANGISVSGGDTGTSFSTGSNTQGMGDVISSQPSNTPGDVAGSTKGSGDIASNLNTYSKKAPKTKNKLKKKKIKDSINAVENKVIRKFSDMYIENNDFELLKKYLDNFPNDAKSWAQATDEILDIARTAREFYNEFDLDVLHDDEENGYKSINFRSFNSPSEWNIKGKEYIFDVYNKMSNETKEKFLKHIKHMFTIQESKKDNKYNYIGVKDKNGINIYISPLNGEYAYNIGFYDKDNQFILYSENKFSKEMIKDLKTSEISMKIKTEIEENLTDKDIQKIENYINKL